jgi:hypothetical protein
MVALTPLFAFAQTGEWGSRGVSRRFVVRGEKVFAADGRGVAVYDVSQSTVRRSAVAETQAESLDLAFLSDRDLVVATRVGLERYSVGADGALTPAGTRSAPVATSIASNGHFLAGAISTGITIWQAGMLDVVSIFPVVPAASALAWHGDTLATAVPGVAIYLLDVNGTRDPVVVSEDAHDLEIVGDTMYVACGVNGIAIYDLSNESTPRLLSRTDAGDRNFAHIAVSGARLVASELPNTVSIYDISGGAPVIAARFKEPAQAMAASSNSLFISGTMFDRFGLPTETGAPLRVFDITTAASPQLSSEFLDFAGPLSGAATDGSLAYVVDPPFFRVIDISTTATPREISLLMIDGIGDRVRLKGNQAIIFGRGQVQLIDIGNPYAPRLVKVFDAQGGPPSTAAFGPDTILEGNPYSGFHVVDFASFAEPGQIGGIKGHYYDLVADGDIAYVAQDGVAFVTLDLSDRHNPRPLHSLVIGPVHGELASATPNHPELLVLQTRSGIRIYDLSNPRNPAETSFTPTSMVSVIATDADTAYLASPGLLQRLNLTDPARPMLTATASHPFSAMQVAAVKGKVVIADRYSLRVIGPNTAPPPAPPPTRRRSAGH